MTSGPVGLVLSPVSGGQVKYLNIAGTDYNNNYNNFRDRSLAGTGNHRFTIPIPPDFNALLSAVLIGYPNASNAAAPVDYYTEYGGVGELYNVNTESQVGGTENVVADTQFEFDISGLSGLIRLVWVSNISKCK
jgi:hypothetical protein